MTGWIYPLIHKKIKCKKLMLTSNEQHEWHPALVKIISIMWNQFLRWNKWISNLISIQGGRGKREPQFSTISYSPPKAHMSGVTFHLNINKHEIFCFCKNKRQSQKLFSLIFGFELQFSTINNLKFLVEVYQSQELHLTGTTKPSPLQ